VYNASGYDDGPDVNPVDGRVAFWNILGGGGILTVSSTFSGRAVVPGTVPNDGFPRWSADGAWLSYARYDPTAISIFKVRPDGTGRAQLFPVADAHNHSVGGNGGGPPAAWTADGLWVVTPALMADVWGLYAFATDGSGCMLPIPAAGGATVDYVSAIR
jgi:hypothetical protein